MFYPLPMVLPGGSRLLLLTSGRNGRCERSRPIVAFVSLTAALAAQGRWREEWELRHDAEQQVASLSAELEQAKVLAEQHAAE